ncbi:hypothetical protein F4859DRAFT_136041 [Xylaria cf. heliscus]|nr:hypothetical protein F4859DRAFT_136041 [Xylaria cf. heliscus]
MLSKTLLTATLIGAATAQVPAIARRDFLERRQGYGIPTDVSLDPQCATALSTVSTLYDSVPTPAADLLAGTLPTDPCETPTFTGNQASEWVSYTSAAIQWYSSHSSQLLAFATACSGILDTEMATSLPACSSDAGAGTTTGSSSSAGITSPPSSSGAGVSTGASSASGSTHASSSGASHSGASSTGSPSSSTVSPNAAPRETGFVVAAAVAAAGFMGAVAAL